MRIISLFIFLMMKIILLIIEKLSIEISFFLIYFTNFQIFFVLRKKESQVTFLHLYHHSLTPLETWICVKFIPGGHGTLGNLINNAVHVIMYLYYMVSAMGPEYQKYLWWKKHLTTVQLVGILF